MALSSPTGSPRASSPWRGSRWPGPSTAGTCSRTGLRPSMTATAAGTTSATARSSTSWRPPAAVPAPFTSLRRARCSTRTRSFRAATRIARAVQPHGGPGCRARRPTSAMGWSGSVIRRAPPPPSHIRRWETSPTRRRPWIRSASRSISPRTSPRACCTGTPPPPTRTCPRVSSRRRPWRATARCRGGRCPTRPHRISRPVSRWRRPQSFRVRRGSGTTTTGSTSPPSSTTGSTPSTCGCSGMS